MGGIVAMNEMHFGDVVLMGLCFGRVTGSWEFLHSPEHNLASMLQKLITVQ